MPTIDRKETFDTNDPQICDHCGQPIGLNDPKLVLGFGEVIEIYHQGTCPEPRY